MKIWVVSLTGGILLVLGWAGVRLLRPRRASGTRLARIVVDVFGDDWARQLGRSPDELRAAILRAPASALARELDALICVVNVRFERNRASADVIAAALTCAYAQSGATTTARLRLPWDSTPADVRAEFLRNGTATAIREWTVPAA